MPLAEQPFPHPVVTGNALHSCKQPREDEIKGRCKKHEGVTAQT